MLDKTFKDTWETRNGVLLDEGYRDYLASEEWQEVKAKAKSRDFYKKCYVCGCSDKPLELHHRSYKYLYGNNKMRNIVAVCRQCHEDIHSFAKSNNISVRMATKKLRKKFRQVVYQ